MLKYVFPGTGRLDSGINHPSSLWCGFLCRVADNCRTFYMVLLLSAHVGFHYRTVGTLNSLNY